MDQIKENKIELKETIRKYGKMPINPERTAFLANCWAAYKALCVIDETSVVHAHEMDHDDHLYISREMAEKWAAGMKNADDTCGPHFSMDKVKEIMKEHGVDCDPGLFWIVMNLIYSDDVAVAKKHNVNTVGYYVDMAKAWINDVDAVGHGGASKAVAYYTNVVEH